MQVELRILKSVLLADISVKRRPEAPGWSPAMRSTWIEATRLTIWATCLIVAAVSLSFAVLCSGRLF